MNAASQTLHPETCEDSHSVISLQESGDGRKLSNERECQQIDMFGQVPVRARRSASPAASKAFAIHEIYGRTSFGSSKSADLSESLANKLKQRLDTVGSTVYRQIWKAKVTPLGRRYWAHIAREQTTTALASIGLPTPCARDGKDLSRNGATPSGALRNSPSLATVLLKRGMPWQVICQVYGLVMGYGTAWHEAKLRATATPSA